MITVECRHGATWEGPEYTRPPVLDHVDRVVAVFRSWHTAVPELRRSAAADVERGRWELFRQGVEGAARRTRRGTWILECPRCRRNLQVPARQLFRLLDARHFGAQQAEPGRLLDPRARGWDTTIDLAQILRAHG